MSLNRGNMLIGSDSPKLARTDINDMFADLGYGASGNVSPITTTGEIGKLVKTDTNGDINIGATKNYKVNNVALKDVSETLTNKTLTAPVLNAEVTGTGVTTTGEANKLFKFSTIANTILHFLRIRKSSTTALNVQDDSSVDVFNVDTANKIVTSYNQKISSLAGTGNRMVTVDSTGNLSASGSIGIGSDGTVNLTTNEIKVKPNRTLSLVAGTWYNVCESSPSQPDDTIMVNLACYISSGNNHSALIAVSKCSGFYRSATTLASSSTGLIPTYAFRINAGFLQISFNATNLPSSFNAHTIARF